MFIINYLYRNLFIYNDQPCLYSKWRRLFASSLLVILKFSESHSRDLPPILKQTFPSKHVSVNNPAKLKSDSVVPLPLHASIHSLWCPKERSKVGADCLYYVKSLWFSMIASNRQSFILSIWNPDPTCQTPSTHPNLLTKT